MANYREKYENYYGTRLSTTTDVHHLDYVHANNNVQNLVALPEEVHNKLHQLRAKVQSKFSGTTVSNVQIPKSKDDVESIKAIIEYYNYLIESKQYINKRDHLV